MRTDTARAFLDNEIANRSRFADPEDIPKWLPAALKSATPVTVGDVHAIRSRVLQEARNERAKDAPNSNKLRILSSIQESLLDDMGIVEGDDIQTALAFSRELNQKFTQGSVGRLLGHERAGAEAVAPADTLDVLLQGRSGTNVRQFMDATPDAQPQLEQFISSRYLESVVEPGFTRRAHQAFLRRYRTSGVWEELPGLEQQLLQAGQDQNRAVELASRVGRAEASASSRTRSRTGLYLEAPIGQEMRRVLSSQNPAGAARTLTRRMQGDPVAVQGAKQQYTEELFRMAETGSFDAEGTPLMSGNRLRRVVNENRDVANALRFTDNEMARLNRTVELLRKAEVSPAGGDTPILTDRPARILEFAARWLGAQSGQRAAQGMGSSLVMAQFGSQQMRQALERIVGDRAKQLIIDAQTDRTLYAALLTRSDDPVAKQNRAASRLNAWLISVGATGEE